jgi:hypothetical protein
MSAIFFAGYLNPSVGLARLGVISLNTGQPERLKSSQKIK